MRADNDGEDHRFILDRDGKRYGQPVHGKLLQRFEVITAKAQDGRRRAAPTYTDDPAENFAQHVALIARSYTEIYRERTPKGETIIFRSPRQNEALVAERKTDRDIAVSQTICRSPTRKLWKPAPHRRAELN